MIGGNLDQDDPDAIGVLDPHLDQSPRLCCGFPDDADSGCDQPGVLGVDIPYLDPDHHRVPGRAGRVPGNFEQSRAQEEHHSGIVPRAELPVDGQAQDIAVEAAAAVQVAGAQEDPAAQNIHATISAPRRVTSEVKQNAHSAALLRGRLLKADDCPARPDLDVLYSEVVVRQGSPGCFQRLLRARSGCRCRHA